MSVEAWDSEFKKKKNLANSKEKLDLGTTCLESQDWVMLIKTLSPRT